MRLTDEQRAWLRLTMIPGVGTAHFIRLLARFHKPVQVLRASEGALREVVGPALAQRIVQYADAVDVDAQERQMEQCDAHFVSLEDKAYPPRLAEIYDPPLALFIRGDLRDEDECCVAIVGTRRASPYGIRMAEKFGSELAARGVTVVSGMANGIDAAAHRGAIEAGGRTIAVLGCGVDVVYPPQNGELMQQIIQHGCVVSQFMMGIKPMPGHFPYRNRIVSGLTQGTLVVEAPPESGALITARQALEQGREVFAIPGPIGSANSHGPHALIREGGKLTETVDDILVELDLPPAIRKMIGVSVVPPKEGSSERKSGVSPTPMPTSRPDSAVSPLPRPVSSSTPLPRVAVSVQEQKILEILSPNGSFVDEIAAHCRIPVSEALSSLTMLELKGLVRQFSGKRFTPV